MSPVPQASETPRVVPDVPKSTTLRHLGRDSALYGIGTLSQRAAQLLLIPLYTTVLSTAEYGTYETLVAMVQTLSILVNFGLSNSLLRFYSECRDESEVDKMIRTSSLLVLVLSSASFVVLLPFTRGLAVALFQEAALARFILLAVLWSIGSALNQQLFAYYRAKQAATRYVAVSLGILAGLLILNVTLVRFMGLGLTGILVGYLFVYWSVNVWLVLKFWRYSHTVSLSWARQLLSFGSPLILSMLGWFVLNSSDRYFLAYYRDLSEVGLYGLGYKIGLLLQMVVIAPFQLAWGPYVFARFAADGDASTRGEYARVFTYLMIALSLLGTAIFLFAPELVRLFGSGKFDAAVAVVPYVLVACVFKGIFYWSASMFHLAKRTLELGVIVLGMAGLNLLLNYLWIPRLGWIGAATSTVVTIGGTGLLTLMIGQRFYRVPMHRKCLAKVMLATGVVVTISVLVHAAVGPLNWGLRTLLLLFLPFLLLLLRVLQPSEVRFLLALPTEVRSRVFHLEKKTR